MDFISAPGTILDKIMEEPTDKETENLQKELTEPCVNIINKNPDLRDQTNQDFQIDKSVIITDPNELTILDNLEGNVIHPSNSVISEDASKESMDSKVTENEMGGNDAIENKETSDYDAFVDQNDVIYRKYNLRLHRVKTVNFEPIIVEASFKRKKSKIVQEEEDLFECKICSQFFKNRTGLTCHMKSHIAQNQFSCTHCEEIFDNNVSFMNHMQTHSENNCFVCTICKQAFSKEMTYLQHKLNHLKGPYNCPVCLITSDDRNSIKAHITTHFLNTETCPVCHKEIKANKMKFHLKMHDDPGINCVECGKVSKDKKSYDYHMRSHTGVRPYQCLYCGKGFKNDGQRNVHTRLHTGEKRFECKTCFQRFTQQGDCKKHERRHNEDYNIKKHKCNICNKTFKNKEYIKHHMKYHDNYKPYKCPSCDMSFVTSSHLNMHNEDAHLTDQIYKCTVCDLGFVSKRRLNKHYATKIHQRQECNQENKKSNSTER